MPYSRAFWDAKRASREKRWQEENDEYATKSTRCAEIAPLLYVTKHLYFKPEIPRGFKVGGTHHFE